MYFDLPDPQKYGISLKNGFLPEEAPLRRLPAYFELWEKVVDELPLLIHQRKVRERIDSLPLLDKSQISNEREYQRAYSILGFLAHAYIWSQPAPVARLPSNISIPWTYVSSVLGLPPVGTYSGLCLWNWKLPPAGANLEECDLEQLEILQTFTGTRDEAWFYLVSVELERLGGPCIANGMSALAAVRSRDDQRLEASLWILAESIDSMSILIRRLPEACDPEVFYDILRPFLAGWKNMQDFGLPENGIFYGSDDTPKAFSGGSNAQSSLIQVLDILLSVHHGPVGSGSPANATTFNPFLIEMRKYMPRSHRNFLEDLEKVANLREYVMSRGNSRLTTAYDVCVTRLSEFRTQHIQIVTRYVTIPSRKSKSDGKVGLALSTGQLGTGGTVLMPFLKQVRDETGDAAVEDITMDNLGQGSFTFNKRRHLHPFDAGEVKILLLENVNRRALDIFDKEGYEIEFLESSLPDEELIKKIQDVHVIGIRSKTQLNENILRHAKNLLVIGCFCIGTNQVDLDYAANRGIAVFNSPFSNSRSVAELVIGYIVILSRQICDRSSELHTGDWNKVAKGCWEVRGKTLGIVGYGHIGSQLSVLAEAMGLKVIYYDVLNIMAMGAAVQVSSLEELLSKADFVTLHVPETPETHNMISTKEFAIMKDGSYIINASRGCVVDIPALIAARKSQKIAGAAIDVYPKEPRKNGADSFNNTLNGWTSDLISLGNIVLTPHIGGSTKEAQTAIGIEVATALTKYINEGCSIGSVNFPEVSLRQTSKEVQSGRVRVLYIHENVPGVLHTVNRILGEYNITKQYSDSQGSVAYLMADIAEATPDELRKLHDELELTPHKIATRMLY